MRRLPRNLIFIKFQIHYTGLHHVVLNVFMIWFLFWPWILPFPRQCCLFFLILPHKKSLWDLIPHRSKQHLLFPGCCAKKTYPRENTATTLAEQILYWAQCSGLLGLGVTQSLCDYRSKIKEEGWIRKEKLWWGHTAQGIWLSSLYKTELYLSGGQHRVFVQAEDSVGHYGLVRQEAAAHHLQGET